jgi:PAS domain S-box-containing protein
LFFAILGISADRQRKVSMNATPLSAWHYRQIAEHGGDVNWIIDGTSGQLLYLSPAADGLPYDDAALTLMAARLAAALPERRRLLAGGDSTQRRHTEESTLARADGEQVPVEIVSTLVEDEGDHPAVLVGLVRDVSARHAQQLAQKKFASMVSHEFRTPLATIDGAIQRLEMTAEAAGADEPTRKRYRKIQVAVDRILAMLDEYLSPERMASLGRERAPNQVAPLAFLESAAAQARSPQHQVHVVAGKNLPATLRCDPAGLQLALQVLLDNANKYSGPGAAITLSGTAAAEGGVEFMVADAGPGLHADEIPLLFDKFFRGRDAAAQAVSGSGLGLYMARAVVEQHGGTLTADNRPGGGAVFRIWLPFPADSGKNLA